MIEAFKKYVSNYDMEIKGIKLKYDHSFRVMSLSEKYALKLNFSEEDVYLAKLIGLLHDIGRFEQMKVYNTFVDKKSIDHADYSVDRLFNHNEIKLFHENEEDYDCYECDDEYTLATKLMSQHLMVNVPINLMYKFQFPNSSITIEPYVGLTLKGHLLGNMGIKYSYEACCDDLEDELEEELEDIDEDDSNINYFDKKDMGGKKYVATRLNYGWQIGANVDFGSAFAGISYGSDFNNYMKSGKDDWKFSALNVTVGVRF